MSVSFDPSTKGSTKPRDFNVGEKVIYKGKPVEIVNKQEFTGKDGIYFLYRIKNHDKSLEPPIYKPLAATTGISSTNFTKIETNLQRTNLQRIGSNDSTKSTDSNGSMVSADSYEIDGGAMTKNRKSKNRKSKNRKSKNRKSKNRKTKNRKKSTYIGGTSNKGFMDLLKKYNLEEYEDLFVIKDKDRDNHRDGKHLQKNTVGNNSSPKVIYNTLQIQPQNTVVSNNSSPKNNTLQTQPQNTVVSNNSQIIKTGGSKGANSWNWICNNFERKARESSLNIKISSMSSAFMNDYNATYGGIIFWHNQERSHLNTINGQGLYAIYVLIQNTQEWPAEHFGVPGIGRVHDHLYKQVMGVSMKQTDRGNAACSSGFSIFHDNNEGWCIRFSSIFLNSNTQWSATISCGSNNSKMTNLREAIIIIGAVMQWITDGPGSDAIEISYIPDQWRYNNRLVNDYYWPLNSCGTDTNNRATWYNPELWNCIPNAE